MGNYVSSYTAVASGIGAAQAEALVPILKERKKGGKKYALHGGASLEERLVPVLIFTKSTDTNTAVAEQPVQKQVAELKDEFEGII